MSSLSVPARPGLAIYAKAVVLAVFALIFVGGLVTSWGAGMAAPDWPVTFGSLNPAGWWENFPLRLEHGHRLTATYVGFLTAILAAAVWRHRVLVISMVTLAGLHALYLLLGKPHAAAHASSGQPWQSSLIAAAIILSFGGIFAAVLASTSPPAREGERTLRSLAFAAFVGVCLQATLGGIRVTSQTAGAADLALALRIIHGCVAQAYLCLVVAVATLLSPKWRAERPAHLHARLRLLAWATAAVVFIQLIVGATMRHMGAGLAIPTFPAAALDGSLFPQIHAPAVELNYTHTRVGALLVTLVVLSLAVSTFRSARGEARLVRPACTLLALVAVQLTLGVLVVFHSKPPTLTTFHVVNGALILATTLLLALRLQDSARSVADSASASTPAPAEVPA